MLQLDGNQLSHTVEDTPDTFKGEPDRQLIFLGEAGAAFMIWLRLRNAASSQKVNIRGMF